MLIKSIEGLHVLPGPDPLNKCLNETNLNFITIKLFLLYNWMYGKQLIIFNEEGFKFCSFSLWLFGGGEGAACTIIKHSGVPTIHSSEYFTNSKSQLFNALLGMEYFSVAGNVQQSI